MLKWKQELLESARELQKEWYGLNDIEQALHDVFNYDRWKDCKEITNDYDASDLGVDINEWYLDGIDRGDYLGVVLYVKYSEYTGELWIGCCENEGDYEHIYDVAKSNVDMMELDELANEVEKAVNDYHYSKKLTDKDIDAIYDVLKPIAVEYIAQHIIDDCVVIGKRKAA